MSVFFLRCLVLERSATLIIFIHIFFSLFTVVILGRCLFYYSVFNVAASRSTWVSGRVSEFVEGIWWHFLSGESGGEGRGKGAQSPPWIIHVFYFLLWIGNGLLYRRYYSPKRSLVGNGFLFRYVVGSKFSVSIGEYLYSISILIF